MRRALLLSVLTMFCSAPAAHAVDTCDVVFQLDDTQPQNIVAFGVDYSGAGGDFVGDSSYPSFGGSWGSVPLACTPLVGDLNEVTLYDDNAGDTLSAFLTRLLSPLTGPLPLLSCVFALDAGFPCPDPTAFGIVHASFPEDPFGTPIRIPPPPLMSISVAARTPQCGDGFVEGGEECDDGNAYADDCCVSCQKVTPGSACDDHDVCSSGETCDEQANCVAASTLTCDDGVFCTYDRCDAQLGCISETRPRPTSCGHWNSGSLSVRDDAGDDTQDQLRIKLALTSGAHMGDPTASTDYAVCIFDHVSGENMLADKIEIPAGSPWMADGTSGSFRYVDPARAQDGLEQIRLLKKAGGARGKFLLKGIGANLTLPGPHDSEAYFANDPEVVVQLENSEGRCWNGRFEIGESKIRTSSRGYRAKR